MQKLDSLLEVWSRNWCAEKNGGSVEWIEYTPEALKNRLQDERWFKTSGLSQTYTLGTQSTGKSTFVEISRDEPEIISNQAVKVDNGVKGPYHFSEGEKNNTTDKANFSSQIKYSIAVGAKLTAGVLPVGADIHMDAALERINRHEQQSESSQEHKTEGGLDCEPGVTTSISKQKQLQNINFMVSFNAYLHGFVVIACKSHVKHASINGRKGDSHKKWPIAIEEVFADLLRFKDEPNVSDADKAVISAAIHAGELDDTRFQFNGDKVYFRYSREAQRVRSSFIDIKLRQETNNTLSSSANTTPADESRRGRDSGFSSPVIGREINIRGVVDRQGNNTVILGLDDKEYDDERYKQNTVLRNSGNPGDKINVGTVVLEGEHSKALVMSSSANVNPSFALLAKQFGSPAYAAESKEIFEPLAQTGIENEHSSSKKP